MLKYTHKILIVDDEPVNRKLLEQLLERDYEPITASSGQEALEILRREDISLLITDQQMPGMRGNELISLCRAANRDIVCMLMSSVNDAQVFIDALTKSGAVRIINKPWKAKEILHNIESALVRYESFRECKHSVNRLKQETENISKIMRKED